MGQYLFVASGGFYQATAKADSTHVTLKNLGATINASPTTTVPNTGQVSPAGFEGPALVSPLPIANGGTGQSSKIPAFGALSPLTTTGDIISYSGGANVRITAGTANYVLTANGAGVLPSWAVNAPQGSDIQGSVPVAKGGTGATTAAGARTNLAVPGLVASNNFTGSNAFDVLTGVFRVDYDGDFVIIADSSGVVIRDLSGGASADFENKQLLQQWTQTRKSYTTATTANFNSWTDVETVVSTYSSTGAQAITMPSGVDGRVVRIIDAAGNAGTNNITLTRANTDTIVGGTTYVINVNYGSVAFLYVAALTKWVILP